MWVNQTPIGSFKAVSQFAGTIGCKTLFYGASPASPPRTSSRSPSSSALAARYG